MVLQNYLDETCKQDRREKHKPMNLNSYDEDIQKVLELKSLGNIEENLLDDLKQLEPFIFRPITVLFSVIKNLLYFEKRYSNTLLKEKMEKDYFIKFEENLCSSAQCLHKNLEVVLNNLLGTGYIKPNKLRKVKELQNKLEEKNIDRKIVQWFNNQFPRNSLFFHVRDCEIKAAQARKDVKDKYSLELRFTQRERDLKKQEH